MSETWPSWKATISGARKRNYQQELLWLMQHVSENYWAARWLAGLEYILWRAVLENDPWINRGLLIGLQKLAYETNGWWEWPAALDDPIFIDMSDWLDIYAEAREGLDNQIIENRP